MGDFFIFLIFADYNHDIASGNFLKLFYRLRAME